MWKSNFSYSNLWLCKEIDIAFVLQDGEWLHFTPLKWEGGKLLCVEFQFLADIGSYVSETGFSVRLSPNETDEFDVAFHEAMAPVRGWICHERAEAMKSARGVFFGK